MSATDKTNSGALHADSMDYYNVNPNPTGMLQSFEGCALNEGTMDKDDTYDINSQHCEERPNLSVPLSLPTLINSTTDFQPWSVNFDHIGSTWESETKVQGSPQRNILSKRFYDEKDTIQKLKQDKSAATNQTENLEKLASFDFHPYETSNNLEFSHAPSSRTHLRTTTFKQQQEPVSSTETSRIAVEDRPVAAHELASLDDETILKEKRGVVKRRSTASISYNDLDSVANNKLPPLPESDYVKGVQQETMAELAGFISTPRTRDDHGPTQMPLSPVQDEAHLPEPRPSSSISNQEAVHFQDFDGVHFVPEKDDTIRDTSTKQDRTQQSLRAAVRSTTVDSLRHDKGMVYYPAPVPIMLNLPPKLSKTSHNESRQRRSMAFLEHHPNNRSSMFGHQSLHLSNTSQKDASAVATLESLLDASANAPPMLGTIQHSIGKQNIKGHAIHKSSESASQFRPSGEYLQPSEKIQIESLPPNAALPVRQQDLMGRNILDDTETDLHNLPITPATRASMSNALQGNSSDINNVEVENDKGDAEADRHVDDEEGSHILEEEEELKGDVPGVPPSSLLAELESRKNRQRQRTKNTPLRYGTGLRSTLLELDAVAEVQRESRRRLPTTLAWQHDNTQSSEQDEDEDVPLAFLFSGSMAAQKSEAVRAPGLLARRELEENEPLSKRRERLKGVNARGNQDHAFERTKAPLSAAHAAVDQDTHETNEHSETLQQRRHRLQAEHEYKSYKPQTKLPDDSNKDKEESLAQRKRRLQGLKQVESFSNRDVKQQENVGQLLLVNQPSMSELLQSNPQRQSYLVRDKRVAPRGLLATNLPDGYRAQQEQQQQLGILQGIYPHNNISTYVNPFQYHGTYAGGTTAYPMFNNPMLPLHSYPLHNTLIEHNAYQQIVQDNLDSHISNVLADHKSREMVERWRTSVI